MDLKKKLEDAEIFDQLADLQEMAEEMFAKYTEARSLLAGMKAKNLVMMEEVQRLEQENGELRTELDDIQNRYCRAKGEVELVTANIKEILTEVRKVREENDALQKENYRLQMELRERGDRVETAPAENLLR